MRRLVSPRPAEASKTLEAVRRTNINAPSTFHGDRQLRATRIFECSRASWPERRGNGATKTWTNIDAKSGECSGAVTDVGFDASVRIDFCHKQSCAITLVHQPSANWIATFGDIKQKLSEKCGPPSLNPESIPESCRKETQFVSCLEEGRIRLRFQWEWPTKQRLELTVGKPESGDEPSAIRIKYVSPQTRLRKNAAGL